MSSKKRKVIILRALKDLGGEATTRQIAEEMIKLNVNGVSQSLGVMPEVECLGGNAGETKWKLLTS